MCLYSNKKREIIAKALVIRLAKTVKHHTFLSTKPIILDRVRPTHRRQKTAFQPRCNTSN